MYTDIKPIGSCKATTTLHADAHVCNSWTASGRYEYTNTKEKKVRKKTE
jgi:hypothetical protein